MQGNVISKMMPSESELHVEPIELSNLLSWARRTAREDRRRYKIKHRPLSAQRLGRMLTPNLQRPIFIVGAPRSGTTFLGECLAELPEISYHFEPVATKAAARYVYEGRWNLSKAQWFYRTVYAWLMRLHFDADLRFAEKTPQVSFIIFFLAKAFPDAQFIHIIRDGRDSALSYSKKPWLKAVAAASKQREAGGYLNGPYARFWVEAERQQEFETTSDIHRCIWAWRRHTESVLAQMQNLHPSQYYEIRYERLVADPATEATNLSTYLGLSNSTSCRLLHTAFSQVRQSSVGAWQRELSLEQLQQIEREAGSLLQQLGYLS